MLVRKKNLVHKFCEFILGMKTNLGTKKYLGTKKLGPKKIWVRTEHWGSKKNWVQKKNWVRKKNGYEKFKVRKKNWGNGKVVPVGNLTHTRTFSALSVKHQITSSKAIV